MTIDTKIALNSTYFMAPYNNVSLATGTLEDIVVTIIVVAVYHNPACRLYLPIHIYTDPYINQYINQYIIQYIYVSLCYTMKVILLHMRFIDTLKIK